MYSSISTGESKLRMQPVHALHQLADRVDDGAELDADGAVLARRLDDDRKLQVVREIEPAAEALGEHRRVDAVKREDLLRDRLVLRQHQAVGAGAGVFLAEQLQERRDLEIGGVVVGERLGEVEHEIAVDAGQAEQALLGAIELVHHRLVAELGERLGDLLLDLFLVERAAPRATSRCAAGSSSSSTSTRSYRTTILSLPIVSLVSNFPRVRKFIASVVASAVTSTR